MKNYAAGDIGYFPLKALKDICQGEEIITDYGDGYWKTMVEWRQQTTQRNLVVVSLVTERENRLKRRRTGV